MPLCNLPLCWALVQLIAFDRSKPAIWPSRRWRVETSKLPASSSCPSQVDANAEQSHHVSAATMIPRALSCGSRRDGREREKQEQAEGEVAKVSSERGCAEMSIRGKDK